MSMIRQAVVREIDRKKQTGYAFAKKIGAKLKIHPMTIMKWLYSGHRISLDMAERVLKHLGMAVVPKDTVKGGNGKKK